MHFSYDVFLSHSAADKPVVRALAERLRSDGLRVWLDDWAIRPGDSILVKIEEGLAASRILVLCMSAAAFGSDWTYLESQTFQFRDPLNRERRFIPLRLDETMPKGSLAQFMYVDWRVGLAGDEGRHKEKSYMKLLEACRPPQQAPSTMAVVDDQGAAWSAFLVGHTDEITSVAFSRDGLQAISGSVDNTLRLWEVATGRLLRVFEGHAGRVTSVALNADGLQALSGSLDQTVRVWDVATGRTLGVFRAHTDEVMSVAFSRDGRRALSGSNDKTVMLWNVISRDTINVFHGHTSGVTSVAFSWDGQRALSGSSDKTVLLWNLESRSTVSIFYGHTDLVTSVAFSRDGQRALSGSRDGTIRMWKVATGKTLKVFQDHTGPVASVAFSANGRRVLSGSSDNTVRLWDVATGRALGVFKGHTGAVTSVAFSGDDRQVLSGSHDKTVRLWDIATGRALSITEGHIGVVTSVAFSSDCQQALSASRDNTIRLWDVATARTLAVLEGHAGAVTCVAFSADGRQALSGSDDHAIRLWDVATARTLAVLEGHAGTVTCVAFSGDGRQALSGSEDHAIRLWDVATARVLAVLEGHDDTVTCVAFSGDGRQALSGSEDQTIRIWDVPARRALGVFEGHTGAVASVAFSGDGQQVLSGSRDKTIRLWQIATRRALGVFRGHTDAVCCVAFSGDYRQALSGSCDKTVRLWEVGTGRALGIFKGHTGAVTSVAFSGDDRQGLSGSLDNTIRLWGVATGLAHSGAADTVTSLPMDAKDPSAQLEYTNAKVLLVGESGVGKTGLSMRLATNTWQHTDSTVGAWATQWRIDMSSTDRIEREIWIWDFGGQADQRLIHQLYMNDTSLAVLVFDPQKDDVFDVLGQWDRDLSRAVRGKAPSKLLVAGRIDGGGLRVARSRIEEFAAERGFASYLETSAKVGTGCEALRAAIVATICWDELPWRSSPRLFKRLKDEIIRFKDEGRVLMRFKDLRDALALRMSGDSFLDEELEAVVGLLEGPGVVWKLDFGSWVLLQPECVNAYAQAVIQTVRADRRDLGTISEERILLGDLSYQSTLPRLPAEDERIVLLAMHQILVERGLCLREHTSNGTQLVFPSFYRRERPDFTGDPAVFISYRFDGFLDDIYATLIVRLRHAEPFKLVELWRYAADFETLTGKRLGVKLTRRAEGAGELEVYFDPGMIAAEQIIFSKYVHEHLLRNAREGVVRLRHYVCQVCATPVGNREVAMARLAAGKPDIVCVNCEARVPLQDDLERLFAMPEMARQTRERDQKAKVALNGESQERVLVGEVISTVELAGQISRELTVSDHDIDMEIEFKSNAGEATGKKLYLQLKSGDSPLTRRRVDLGDPRMIEVFEVKDDRHARYWMDQQFPVMLVVRSAAGEIRWMEIGESLRSKGASRREIVFDPERFDVMSVRRWRDRALHVASGPTVDRLVPEGDRGIPRHR